MASDEGIPPSFESQRKLAQDRPLGLALKDEELIHEKEFFLLEFTERREQSPKEREEATTRKLFDLHGPPPPVRTPVLPCGGSPRSLCRASCAPLLAAISTGDRFAVALSLLALATQGSFSENAPQWTLVEAHQSMGDDSLKVRRSSFYEPSEALKTSLKWQNLES